MVKAARFRVVAAVLIVIDAVLAAASAFMAYKLRFYPEAEWSRALAASFAPQGPYFHILLLAPVVRLFCSYVLGLYNVRRRSYRLSEDFPYLLSAATLGSAVLVIIAFFGVFQYRSLFEYRTFSYSRFFFFFDWILNLFLVASTHTLIGILRNELSRRGIGAYRVGIQGIGQEGQSLAAEKEVLAESGYRVIGFIAKDYEKESVEVEGDAYPVLGEPTNIREAINEHDLDEIVVTNVGMLGTTFMEFSSACHELDVVVKIVPDLYGILYQGRPVDEIGGLPVIQVNDTSIAGLPRLLKRGCDIAVSSLALALLSPVLIASALLVKLSSPGPIIFVQNRIGKNGRSLRMYKFRSMYQDAERRRAELAHLNLADGPLFKMKDDPRITRVGRILRKTSIDELPQLVNVLKGDMSLVGPRPLPMSDISDPDAWEKKRFAATPGITGLWQVNRTLHTSEEMLKWDLYYIDNWSFWLDFKILLKTFFVVLTGKGAH